MNKWTKMNLEQLADSIGQPGSLDSHAVEIEMLRRQTEAQIRSAKYMLLSVIALAVASGVGAFFDFLDWYTHHPN